MHVGYCIEGLIYLCMQSFAFFREPCTAKQLGSLSSLHPQSSELSLVDSGGPTDISGTDSGKPHHHGQSKLLYNNVALLPRCIFVLERTPTEDRA